MLFPFIFGSVQWNINGIFVCFVSPILSERICVYLAHASIAFLPPLLFLEKFW